MVEWRKAEGSLKASRLFTNEGLKYWTFPRAPPSTSFRTSFETPFGLLRDAEMSRIHEELALSEVEGRSVSRGTAHI